MSFDVKDTKRGGIDAVASREKAIDEEQEEIVGTLSPSSQTASLHHTTVPPLSGFTPTNMQGGDPFVSLISSPSLVHPLGPFQLHNEANSIVPPITSSTPVVAGSGLLPPSSTPLHFLTGKGLDPSRGEGECEGGVGGTAATTPTCHRSISLLATPGREMVESIVHLHTVHQRGGLTDGEFALAKQRILGDPSSLSLSEIKESEGRRRYHHREHRRRGSSSRRPSGALQSCTDLRTKGYRSHADLAPPPRRREHLQKRRHHRQPYRPHSLPQSFQHRDSLQSRAGNSIMDGGVERRRDGGGGPRESEEEVGSEEPDEWRRNRRKGRRKEVGDEGEEEKEEHHWVDRSICTWSGCSGRNSILCSRRMSHSSLSTSSSSSTFTSSPSGKNRSKHRRSSISSRRSSTSTSTSSSSSSSSERFMVLPKSRVWKGLEAENSGDPWSPHSHTAHDGRGAEYFGSAGGESPRIEPFPTSDMGAYHHVVMMDDGAEKAIPTPKRRTGWRIPEHEPLLHGKDDDDGEGGGGDGGKKGKRTVYSSTLETMVGEPRSPVSSIQARRSGGLRWNLPNEEEYALASASSAYGKGGVVERCSTTMPRLHFGSLDIPVEEGGGGGGKYEYYHGRSSPGVSSPTKRRGGKEGGAWSGFDAGGYSSSPTAVRTGETGWKSGESDSGGGSMLGRGGRMNTGGWGIGALGMPPFNSLRYDRGWHAERGGNQGSQGRQRKDGMELLVQLARDDVVKVHYFNSRGAVGKSFSEVALRPEQLRPPTYLRKSKLDRPNHTSKSLAGTPAGLPTFDMAFPVEDDHQRIPRGVEAAGAVLTGDLMCSSTPGETTDIPSKPPLGALTSVPRPASSSPVGAPFVSKENEGEREQQGSEENHYYDENGEEEKKKKKESDRADREGIPSGEGADQPTPSSIQSKGVCGEVQDSATLPELKSMPFTNAKEDGAAVDGEWGKRAAASSPYRPAHHHHRHHRHPHHRHLPPPPPPSLSPSTYAFIPPPRPDHSGSSSDSTQESKSIGASSFLEQSLNWYWIDVTGKDPGERQYHKVIRALTKKFGLCESFLVDREHLLILPQVCESPTHPGQYLLNLRVASHQVSLADDSAQLLTNRWIILIDLNRSVIITLHRVDTRSMALLRQRWSKVFHQTSVEVSFQEFLLKIIDDAIHTYQLSLDVHEELLDRCELRLFSRAVHSQWWLGKNENTAAKGGGGSREVNEEMHEKILFHFGDSASSSFLRKLLDPRSTRKLSKEEINSFLHHLHRRTSVQLRMLNLTLPALAEAFTKFELCSKELSTQMTSTCRELSDRALEIRDDAKTLLDLHLSLQSFHTNELMAVLTRLSLLFTPCTFLAGVYGMNFQYFPELHWTYGYAYFWAFCAILVLGMGYYFRRYQ